MSKKSTPGDGSHGKGSKGTPDGAPRRSVAGFVRGLVAGLAALRRG
ncbi:hypothetical protein [Carbonactinospora thermoautotrophica]|nr:hypothetical protein [Carbonactinospora thermoautotrophica]